MTEPKVAGSLPMVLQLEPGTYYWCSCGHSQKQPFCDGSHGSSEFKPLAFEVEKLKKIPLCLCKRTTKAPTCDGKSHRDL